ncbi:MAG: HPr(Ser) kinase/phosphatase [Spirochaetes bacterium]|nr:HPr(Ser) kinase/phosphatase [Spirochaetota bacterium]
MTNANKVTVRGLQEYAERHQPNLELTLVSVKHTLDREIRTGDVNRPGMNLFGYFEHFAWERVQVFGKGEFTYLAKISKENRLSEIREFFNYAMPCIIFSSGARPPEAFLKLAETNETPVLVSQLPTTQLISQLYDFFGKALAPKVVVHGVMMEIFGLGVLIEGQPGVGKSECALELIERGHRFIADDVVDIRCIEGKTLLAASSKVISHYMELRGLGIINVAHLFGVSAILNEKAIDFIVNLEPFNKRAKYDRLGMEDQYREILGIRAPTTLIPVQPGTNIPILVEAASMNQRLKMMGYNPAREFTKKVNQYIEKGEAFL